MLDCVETVSSFYGKFCSNPVLCQSAMSVNRSPFLGRQFKPSKRLLNVEWVQGAATIPTLRFLAIMAAIMDSVLICLCQKGIWFQEIWPWMGVDMLFVLLFIYFLPVIWIPSIWRHTHTHTDRKTNVWNTWLHTHRHTHTAHVAELSLSGPSLLSLSQPQNSDLGFK